MNALSPLPYERNHFPGTAQKQDSFTRSEEACDPESAASRPQTRKRQSDGTPASLGPFQPPQARSVPARRVPTRAAAKRVASAGPKRVPEAPTALKATAKPAAAPGAPRRPDPQPPHSPKPADNPRFPRRTHRLRRITISGACDCFRGRHRTPPVQPTRMCGRQTLTSDPAAWRVRVCTWSAEHAA